MQFLIRQIQMDNPFQRALCKLLETEGDTLYISSGYASKSILIDNKNKRAQFVDNQNNTYSFLDSVDRGFLSVSKPSITIIGGMYKRYDKNLKQEVPDTYQQSKFNDFLKDLKSEVKGNTINFQRAYNDHWHSKIALKVNKGEPVAAIVGSSNLSTFSFGTNSNWSGFNHEADIYIYKGRKGVRNIKYDISSLKIEREDLINEFISIIKAKEISITDEKEVLERLYSIDIEDSKNLVERIYGQESLQPEWENLQYLLFTIKQINQIISSSNQSKVSANSVITVSPNKSTDQILNDIYTTLQNAIVSYTNQITPNNKGDYF